MIFQIDVIDELWSHTYIQSVWQIESKEAFLLQVLLTPTHLAIVMEYAVGGELFGRICNAGRFSEDEVNYG